MVDFQTEVYNKSGDNITGVKVIIEGENAEVLDTIQIHNKTQFDALVTELNSKLDVIDEKYVQVEDSQLQGLSIEEILENSNNDVDINATTLDGQSSSSFSQTGHTHNVNTLTGVLNYDLSSSDYDITISDSVTLKVKVTNATNSPVTNSPVVILLNGSSFATGNTNASGEFTTTYTPSEYGLQHFSVNNTSIDVNVRDSSTSQSSYYSNKVVVYYNKELKMCQVVISGEFSIGSSGDLISDFPFKPKKTIPFAIYNAGMSMSISDNGTIRYLNSGTTGSKTVVASATFFYQ